MPQKKIDKPVKREKESSKIVITIPEDFFSSSLLDFASVVPLLREINKYSLGARKFMYKAMQNSVSQSINKLEEKIKKEDKTLAKLFKAINPLSVSKQTKNYIYQARVEFLRGVGTLIENRLNVVEKKSSEKKKRTFKKVEIK